MNPADDFTVPSGRLSDADFNLQVQELLATDHGTVDSTLPAVFQAPAPRFTATTAVAATVYSHEAMIELMIAHPEYTHEQFAKAFGRKANWFASVLANEGFQRALEPRKDEIADPGLTATLDERMRALSLHALSVLQSKLDSKEVTDFTVLKSVEIGTKALGMGTAMAVAPAVVVVSGAEAVANRILLAIETARQRQQAASLLNTVDVVAKVLPDGS